MRRDVSEAAIKSWSLVKDAGHQTHGGESYDEAERWYVESGGKLPLEDSSKRQDSVAGQESTPSTSRPTKAKTPLLRVRFAP